MTPFTCVVCGVQGQAWSHLATPDGWVKVIHDNKVVAYCCSSPRCFLNYAQTWQKEQAQMSLL